MKLLITGGAGFAGSNFIRYILQKYPDYQIVNLDKLTYAGNLSNLKDVEASRNYRFTKGDIADEKTIEQLFSEYQFNAVINYAAETHVDRSILEPGAFVRTDVVGTYNLLEAIKEYQIRKYIQISTDEVFGSTETGEFSETSPFKPNSPYSASKAGGDLLCRAYIKTYQLPIIVTHSCNFIGPFQYPEKLIPLAITNLMEGKKVPVYGQGRQIREWIYIQDHCRAIDQLLHHGRIGEVYNIGSGQRKENLEVIKAILKTMGQSEDMIEFIKDRPGHDWRYAINFNKLSADGWQPQSSFNQSITKTIKWYQNHQDWWRPLKSGEYLKYYKKQYKDKLIK